MRAVCGLDVHKDTVYLCILCDDGEIFEKVYGVLTKELQSMCSDMKRRGVTEVTMESTAMYWIPIWRVLEPHFHLKLVNPYFIKQLPGRKSDVKDAQWIAECTQKELVRGSFVPPERIQQLRQYDRRIFDLDAEIVRKLSKLDSIMHRCNIRLSNYVSNTDTKSYKDVVDELCNDCPRGTSQEDTRAHCEQARTRNHPGITDRSSLRSGEGYDAPAQGGTGTSGESQGRVPSEDGSHLQDVLPQGIRTADDHTGHQGARRHIIDRRDRSRHDKIPNCGAPCIMERTEATQRCFQWKVQVAQNYPW